MDPPLGYPEVNQGILRGVHQRVGAADEVLQALVSLGQVPRKHRCSDTAFFAVPALGRAAKYVHHLQVEPTPELIDLLAESDALPLAVTEEQVTRPEVVPVGHRAEHAHQRGHTDPGADKDEAGTVVAVHGERAVRAVQVGGGAGLEAAYLSGEVAGGLDAQGHPLGLLGARGDRERVPGDREGRFADRDPGELPRLEGEAVESAGVKPRGLEYDGADVAPLRDHLFDAPRFAAELQRPDDAHPQDQADKHGRHPEPEYYLQGLINVVADQKDMREGGYYDHKGEHAVRQLPELVADA